MKLTIDYRLLSLLSEGANRKEDFVLSLSSFLLEKNEKGAAKWIKV